MTTCQRYQNPVPPRLLVRAGCAFACLLGLLWSAVAVDAGEGPEELATGELSGTVQSAASAVQSVDDPPTGAEAPLSARQAELILQRLLAAESRINELEAQLANQSPSNQNQSNQEQSNSPKTAAGQTESGQTGAGQTEVGESIFSGELMRDVDHADFQSFSSNGTPPTNDDTAHIDATSDDVVKQSAFDEFEQRVASLEKDFEEFADEEPQFVRSGTPLSTMKVIGRIHADYWSFPNDSAGTNAFESGDFRQDPQDRIGFRRMRIGIAGDIWKNMDYKIEMEFAGGNDSEFRDAYIGFKDLSFLQKLQIGNQKRPYGLDHLNSSRYNVFMERPLVIEAINQDSRRLGIQSLGVSADQQFNWRYGVFNQRLIQDEGKYVGDHLQLQFAGRFAHTFWYDDDGRNYAHWAISGTAAHPDGSVAADNGNIGPDVNEAQFRTRPEARSASRWIDTGIIAGANWYQLMGLEGVLNVGPTQLVGEYQNVWLQRDAGFGPDLHFHGGYGYISYFLTGEHIPWDRRSGTIGRMKPFKNFYLANRVTSSIGCTNGECDTTESGWGAWQIAARYSYADFSDENILGGVGESITLGLNWHWNPNAQMQFNYIFGQISERNVTDVNGLVFDAGKYEILGTRFMVDF